MTSGLLPSRRKAVEPRIVPLSQEAIRVIETNRPLAGHTDFVFPGPKGVAMNNPQKAVSRLRERSKVDFRIHDIRRTVATGLSSSACERTL